MFFICGISKGEKKLDYIQNLPCSTCYKYGKLELYMSYLYFSIFFLPLFRWNKTFTVKSSCCGSIFTIDTQLGKRIARGETVVLTSQDLIPPHSSIQLHITCSNCSQQVSKEYTYCPHCGHYIKS